MQSFRHAPHMLGSPDRPGRRTSIAVFSLRGDAFPAVVSLLLLLAGDIELNPGPTCYPCGKLLHKRVPQTEVYRGLPATHGEAVHPDKTVALAVGDDAAPIRGQNTLALAPTEPGNLFLAGGDFNAHSPLWDEH